MNLKGFAPMIKAALVALIVAAIGWIGFDIPPSAVQETVDGQVDVLLDRAGGAGDAQATTVAASPAVVTQVIDGDTAVVLIDDQEVKLRFIGIDTPETEYSPAGAECYGAQATDRARELLQGQSVTLRSDDTQAAKDVHGRLLVYAELPDGRDFGEVMIAEGFAYEYTYAKDYNNQNAYQNAQRDAEQSGRGLWAACDQ